MSDVIVEPADKSTFPDTGDTTKFGPNWWNRARKFSGGVDGQIVTKSAASATGAAWVDSIPTSRTINGHALSADVIVTKGDLGLGNVENTALSTWGGSGNLVTLGTVGRLVVNNPNGPGAIIQKGSTSNTRAPLVFVEPDGVSVYSYFNSASAFVTASFIILAGNLSAGPNYVGTVNGAGAFTATAGPGTGLAAMLDAYSDVQYGLVCRAANIANAASYLALDHSGNYVFAAMDAGQLQFGASTTLASMDTGLARNAAGVLEINNTTLGTYRDLMLRTLTLSGSAVLANNTGLQFKDSGGTPRNVLQVDNGNVLRLQQAAAANLIIKPGTGQQLWILNNAESAHGLVFFENTRNITLGTNTDANYKLHVARSGSTGTLLVYDSTASTGVTGCVVREGAGQSAAEVVGVYANDGTTLRVGVINGDVKFGKALVALGGGSAPTLGTIGGSGPATAGQNSWLRVLDSTGAACWIPVWK